MPKPHEAEDDVELLTWDPSDGTDEDDEDFDDELAADEAFAGDEDFDDEEEAAPAELEEVASDGYAGEKAPELPQPDRARSHPTLPRVKSTSLPFKRIIR